MFIDDKLVKFLNLISFFLLHFIIAIIIVGKISKMNSLYYGVLLTFIYLFNYFLIYLFIYLFIYFLINFKVSAEMTSFSLDDEG